MTPKTYLKRKKDNLIIKNEREGLTKQDIKDALHGANSFKIKALILTQATSGIAIQDVLQLNIEQFYNGLVELKEGYQICRIHHKRTKSSREHYTFISFEAVALIKKYIKLERLGYTTGPLFTSRVKINTRYSYSTYAIMIYRLIKMLGWYKGNYRYGKLTTHMFRKFFETQLTNAGIINDHLVHLMGWKHKDPLKATYYLANPDELQKSYIKHLDYLTLENVETITLNSPEVKQLQDQIDSQDDEIRNLKKRMEIMQKVEERKKQIEK
jgi:integrase